MAKYKITYDRKNCIGAFTCEGVTPEFWLRPKDGEEKANLKDAVLNEETGMYELIIDEKDYEQNRVAADVCPVKVIKIEKIEE